MSLLRKDGGDIRNLLGVTFSSYYSFDTSTRGDASASGELVVAAAYPPIGIYPLPNQWNFATLARARAEAGDDAPLSTATVHVSQGLTADITNLSASYIDLVAFPMLIEYVMLSIDPFDFAHFASASFFARISTPFFDEAFDESFVCSGPQGTIGTANCDKELRLLSRRHEFRLDPGETFWLKISNEFTLNAVSVPEPPTLMLLTLGLVGIAAARGRKSQSAVLARDAKLPSHRLMSDAEA
jgi:hypothetical protein